MLVYISLFRMPQIDVALFLPMVYGLCMMGIVFYGVALVYIVFSFVANIKMFYNSFQKIQLIEKVLKCIMSVYIKTNKKSLNREVNLKN